MPLRNKKCEHIESVAVLGAGVIGASWTALFLASGLEVHVFDTDSRAEDQVKLYIDNAWPTLDMLGLTSQGNRGSIVFHRSAPEAVDSAQFVQENLPERLELKHNLYREIEPAMSSEAIIASSASGLMLKELQQAWANPSRLILGHPFNPPHLIPLVEILTNEFTAQGVLEIAEAFYEDIGKVTIQVKREVPAHVANRLQAALWKEAIHLVATGVASVEDVDKAVWAGPGLRWAAMGPHMLFHLGAGSGGLSAFCERYTDSFHRWWQDLGNVEITPEVIAELVEGVASESGGNDVVTLSETRDALITEFLRARTSLRLNSDSPS